MAIWYERRWPSMVMNRSRIGGQLWKSGAQAPSVVGGKTFTPAAWYPSSRDPTNGYTVCEVSDGSVSCNCPGWTKRNPPGGRTCKHTQDYEQFLRPLWNNTVSPEPVAAGPGISEPPLQASDQEKGGTLSELFAELDKGGLHGR
jgi:hypothetical protein